jgi:hypothetical protein
MGKSVSRASDHWPTRTQGLGQRPFVQIVQLAAHRRAMRQLVTRTGKRSIRSAM